MPDSIPVPLVALFWARGCDKWILSPQGGTLHFVGSTVLAGKLRHTKYDVAHPNTLAYENMLHAYASKACTCT
jgi:hypothetical protein